jgi:hypothetical protein
MLQTFSFNPRAGALFARSFAPSDHVPQNEQLFYYDPEDDCTNFISQCIWASYGGWVPGFTDDIVKKNAERIIKNIRQVSGVWYGSKSNIGSPKWCRVGEFFEYITAQKETGPQARLVAEGTFTRVSPASVRAGDVIQMVVASYTSERYGHSLYVTKEGAQWEDVTICCHSFDRLDAPMSVFSQFSDNYKKLRVLHFESAQFER